MEERVLRVLWFANTPGLSTNLSKKQSTAGGWISALQTEIENAGQCDLAFAFYSDQDLSPFEFNRTKYYPIQRLARNKKSRLMQRILGKTEYDENLSRFLQIIEDFKPDIIQVHGTENSFGLITDFVSKIPVVVSIQGNLTAYTSKYFSGLPMPYLPKRLRTGNFFLKMDFRQFVKRSIIEREILKKVKYILGRTDWDRRICLTMAPQADYFHQEEIMRASFYENDWKESQSHTPVFHTTSSNSMYKGFETIIDTAVLLKNNRLDFQWTVAGLNEQDPLVRLIKKNRGISLLSDIQVKTMGLMPEKALAGHMANASMYIQVSHAENSPNSVCEAMLLGMPVIATAVGGTSSLITDNDTGILVQDGDAHALAGAITELMNDPSKSKTMAGRAKKIARERHQHQKVTFQLINNYRSILKIHESA
jgi:glycosyltransferase involved in cell wall biosynthesis